MIDKRLGVQGIGMTSNSSEGDPAVSGESIHAVRVVGPP